MSSNDVEFNLFPANRVQALAMLYTQNQNLTGKTPIEITEIYLSAYSEISNNIKALTRNAQESSNNSY